MGKTEKDFNILLNENKWKKENFKFLPRLGILENMNKTVYIKDVDKNTDLTTIKNVLDAKNVSFSNLERVTVGTEKNPTPSVRLILHREQDVDKLTKEGLLFSYKSHRIEKHAKINVPLCFNCGKHGHIAADCTAESKCIKCGSNEHQRKDCAIEKESLVCLNCGENHPATYGRCKTKLQAMRKQRGKMTYADAATNSRGLQQSGKSSHSNTYNLVNHNQNQASQSNVSNSSSLTPSVHVTKAGDGSTSGSAFRQTIAANILCASIEIISDAIKESNPELKFAQKSVMDNAMRLVSTKYANIFDINLVAQQLLPRNEGSALKTPIVHERVGKRPREATSPSPSSVSIHVDNQKHNQNSLMRQSQQQINASPSLPVKENQSLPSIRISEAKMQTAPQPKRIQPSIPGTSTFTFTGVQTAVSSAPVMSFSAPSAPSQAQPVPLTTKSNKTQSVTSALSATSTASKLAAVSDATSTAAAAAAAAVTRVNHTHSVVSTGQQPPLFVTNTGATADAAASSFAHAAMPTLPEINASMNSMTSNKNKKQSLDANHLIPPQHHPLPPPSPGDLEMYGTPERRTPEHRIDNRQRYHQQQTLSPRQTLFASNLAEQHSNISNQSPMNAVRAAMDVIAEQLPPPMTDQMQNQQPENGF